MIKLLFEKQGQFFIITIENKVIKYWDNFQNSLWGGPLQYLPADPSVIRKIDNSRNRIPQYVKEMLMITKEDQEQFDNAKNDEELKIIVLKDCKEKQCKLIEEKNE
jgi:hypothetical protein